METLYGPHHWIVVVVWGSTSRRWMPLTLVMRRFGIFFVISLNKLEVKFEFPAISKVMTPMKYPCERERTSTLSSNQN